MSAKYSHLESSFDEHDPIMGQSMQNRFEKESIHSHPAQFSSSVGFRDFQPNYKGNNRPTSSIKSSQYNQFENKIENPKNYREIIKTLFLNFHKISQESCDQLEVTQDLIYQNEEHLVDLIENTDRFLQDVQEAGFQPGGINFDEKFNQYESNQRDTKRIIKELDGMIGQYAEFPTQKRFLSPNQPSRTFNSAKAERRGSEF